MSRENWTNEKVFFRLVNNKSDRTYWANIKELSSRPNKEVFDQCVEFIKSEEAKKRVIAINVMAQLGVRPRPFYRETIQILFELLVNENNEKVIWSSLYALGHNNEEFKETEISPLTKFRDHKSPEIRHALVSALLRVNNKIAIDTLIHLSNDSDSATRDWATFGLGTQIERNIKKIREALWLRVNDSCQDAKLEAIVGLAKRRDTRVTEIIIRELTEGEYGTLLFEAIEELNDKSFLPYLEKNLVDEKKDDGINSGWLDALEGCIEKLKARN